MSTFKANVQELKRACIHFDLIQNNDLINIAFILTETTLILRRSDVTKRVIAAINIPIQAIYVVPTTYILNYKEFRTKVEALNSLDIVSINTEDSYIEMCSQKITVFQKDNDLSAVTIDETLTKDELQALKVSPELRKLLLEFKSYMRIKTDTNVYTVIDNCIHLKSFHDYMMIEVCNGKEMLTFITNFNFKYDFIMDAALLDFILLKSAQPNKTYEFKLYKHSINKPDSLFSAYHIYGVLFSNIDFYVLRQQSAYVNYKELLTSNKQSLKLSYKDIYNLIDKTPCKVDDVNVAEFCDGVYNIKALERAVSFFEMFEPDTQEVTLWSNDKLLTLRTKYGAYFLKNIKKEW